VAGRPRVRLLEAAEHALFDELGLDDGARFAPALFVLGSPRTGSTLCYQLAASVFGLPFVSNLVDELHATTPALGVIALAPRTAREPIALASAYGKTDGPLQPSEGSAVMRNWFGGGHPSQLVSARFLEGKREHCARTFAAVHAALGGPLVVKNAWNCFRVPELASTFPNARFVWIRRDLLAAARSDLAARHAYLEDPWAWSSASPANLDDLRKLHFTAQVVEAQYAYNSAIGADLAAHAAGRHAELWYEDLCADPRRELERVEVLLSGLAAPDWSRTEGLALERSERPAYAPAEAAAIEEHFEAHRERLLPFRAPRLSAV